MTGTYERIRVTAASVAIFTTLIYMVTGLLWAAAACGLIFGAGIVLAWILFDGKEGPDVSAAR